MSRAAGVVVGRRKELDSVERFVARVPAGVTSLAIVGPAGVGKSTVWQAGVELARNEGYTVLTARPTGAEASLSFAGLADLFAHVGDDVVDGLADPQRHAFRVALLREQARGRVDSRAVATAVYNLLRSLAESRPAVIAVDDAQWLDRATASALRFALHRLVDEPLGVLAAVRLDGVRPETFESEIRAEELSLDPLSAGALHDVIRVRLGRSLHRPTLVRIAQASAGNAYWAIEIARELGRHEPPEDGELPLPPTLQGLVHARASRLPRATRDALLRASALAAPTTASVPEEDLLSAEEEGLVRIDELGRVRFEHPLLAAAIYDMASPAQRRRLHRDLAHTVEDQEERARHLALAATAADEGVASELDAAAAHAASRGASAAAAELARLALGLTVERAGETRVRRSLALARHLLGAGDTGGARAALEACSPDWAEGDLRAELLHDLGNVLWFEGDHDAGYRLACEALEYTRDPLLAARVHGTAAWLAQDSDLERAIAHDDAALALLDPERAPARYSWALLHGAYLRLLDGQGSDDDAYERGAAIQAEGVDWTDTSPVTGMWPIVHDDFARARGFYEPGLVRSRAEGDEPSVQGTLLRLVEIACWTGEWEEADRLAAEGMELADRIGSTAYLGGALYARGLVDAHLGRVDAARAAGTRIVELVPEQLRQQAAVGHWLLGFVALSLGDAGEADAEYTLAHEAVARSGQREPARFRFHPDHIEAVVELGDLPRARALLRALDERAAVFPRPWILATGLRCRALVLAAEGDLAAAEAAVAEALEHHRALAMPFERARTQFVQGVVLRRLKQKRRAREALEEAAATFERLGSPLWLERVRTELRRVASRRAAVGLTATELQIARLAADGLSNPEIAAQAFVSRKTVEANLARVYRKLGLSSRAQLARALDAIS